MVETKEKSNSEKIKDVLRIYQPDGKFRVFASRGSNFININVPHDFPMQFSQEVVGRLLGMNLIGTYWSDCGPNNHIPSPAVHFLQQKLDEKPCKYFKKYKAVYPPKCGCKPCHDKWDASSGS